MSHGPVEPAPETILALATPADTEALGTRLAGWIKRTRLPLLIFLSGDLGAGKTCLARALLVALGVKGRIKSPSYALVETYELALEPDAGFRDHLRLYCYHFDFYRFVDPREWIDAGFRDYLDGSNLCLVEWPENAAAAGHLPVPDLAIRLTPLDSGRSAHVLAATDRGRACLADVAFSQQA